MEGRAAVGDLVTVYGRFDTGRVVAIDTGPDATQHDANGDFILVEMVTGLEWYRPWELSGHRTSAADRVLGAPTRIQTVIRIDERSADE